MVTASPPTEAIDVSTESEDWLAACPEAEELSLKAAQAALAEAAAMGFAAEAALTLGIMLSDDAQQRGLNRTYRGKDSSTNVLSFALADPDSLTPPGAPVLLGDVVLAFETVAREAAEQNKPLSHHLQHLVVHGVLHLLGFDHENDADAAIMEAREVEILQTLGVPDPYCDIM